MRIPIPAIAIPVVVALLYWFVPGERTAAWTPLRVAGACLAIFGYVMVCVARLQLGRSFAVRTVAPRVLVTHGVYSRLRHPIYVFVDLMLVGVLVALRLYWLLLLVPVLVTAQAFKARSESRVLRDAFGERFVEYSKRTWF